MVWQVASESCKPLIILAFDECRHDAAPRARAHCTRLHAGPGQVILLNKPYGVLCQFSPDAQRQADARRIPARSVTSIAAGRLDADSEGLVVLTADGALQARITSPRRKLAKVYWVEVEGDSIAGTSRRTRRRRRARRRRHGAGPSPRDRRAARPLAARAADTLPQGDPDGVAGAHADRRQESSGAPDDRSRRPADAAAHSHARSVRGRWTGSRPVPGAKRPPTDACYDRRARVAIAASRHSPPGPPAPTPVPAVVLLPCSGRLRRPDQAMIRRLLARLLPGRTRAGEPRIYGPGDHPDPPQPAESRRARGDAAAAGRGLQGFRRRRRRARPAARDRAQGLRHCDRRAARAGQAAVPSRVHHRPPLPARARARRAGADRGVDVPRRPDRRRRDRRARPAALRQRLRLAGRRRRAPRLHDQRAVFRPVDRGDLGLRRRRRRHPGPPAEADRGAGDPPARGPRAHAAGDPARRKARRRDRPEDRRADSEARAADAERAAGPPVRRDAEAPALRPRGGDRCAACVRTACRTVSCR